MTTVMKYAGAFEFDELEAEVRKGFRKAARRSAQNGASVSQSVTSAIRFDAILRFGAVNLGCIALLAAAWARGLAVCGLKVWRTGSETAAALTTRPPLGTWAAQYLDAIDGRDSGARAIVASTLRLRLADWIAVIRHFANALVLLGLIGTVIGFVIALSGVDPATASDIKSISPMVSELLAGMAVALYTTLAGAVLNLWLMINHRLLAGATTRLVTSLVERGEDDECA